MTVRRRSTGFSLLVICCCVSAAACGASISPALDARPSDAAQSPDASQDASMLCEATGGRVSAECLVPRGGDDCLDAYGRFAPPNGRVHVWCSSPGVCTSGDRCQTDFNGRTRCTCGNDGDCAPGLLCIAEIRDSTPRCVCPMSR